MSIKKPRQLLQVQHLFSPRWGISRINQKFIVVLYEWIWFELKDDRMKEECQWIKRWREWWQDLKTKWVVSGLEHTNKCHPHSSCWRVKRQRTTRKGRRRLTFWHFVCQDTIVNMLLRFVIYKLVIEVIKRIDWRRRVNLCNQTKIWGECFTSMVKIRDCVISWKFYKQSNRQDISCTEHYGSQETVNCNVLKFMKRDELTEKMVPELDLVDEVQKIVIREARAK